VHELGRLVLCDYVRQILLSDKALGATEVLVKPGTGQVLAKAVSRDYGTAPGQTTVALPTQPAFGPGSTFKVFTLVAAVAQACRCRRRTSPRRATWQSVNTFYIQLEEQVGILDVAAMARTPGIPDARLAKVGPNDGSLTLGTEVVSPLDMATADATLAARGLRCDPRPLTSITTPTGQPVAFPEPAPCRQVLDPAVADTVTSVLEGVLTNGTGYPNAATIGRPAAGKTGTNEAFSSAWFVGYTPSCPLPSSSATPAAAPPTP